MSFSDALAPGLLITATLTLAACGQPPRIGGPDSPLGKARIAVVLPAKPIDRSGRLHFESPEYARRDRDLGLRR